MSETLASTPSPILYFAPELVVELALGAEHPHDVAERYGLDAVEYEHLATLPWFHELVARKRQEFQDNGVLFQAKAAMMAEALLTRLFHKSMNEALTPPIMIEVSKQLTEVGRLKPQPGVAAAAVGPAFQINIQVNGETTQLAAPPLAPSADGHTPPPPSTGITIDLGPEPTPPGPAFPPMAKPPPYITDLKVPNFDRDVRPQRSPTPSALTGSPAAQAAALASPGAPQSVTGTTSVGLPSRSPVR